MTCRKWPAAASRPLPAIIQQKTNISSNQRRTSKFGHLWTLSLIFASIFVPPVSSRYCLLLLAPCIFMVLIPGTRTHPPPPSTLCHLSCISVGLKPWLHMCLSTHASAKSFATSLKAVLPRLTVESLNDHLSLPFIPKWWWKHSKRFFYAACDEFGVLEWGCLGRGLFTISIHGKVTCLRNRHTSDMHCSGQYKGVSRCEACSHWEQREPRNRHDFL